MKVPTTGIYTFGGGSGLRIFRSTYLLGFAMALALTGCATGPQQAASHGAVGLSSGGVRDISTAFQAGVDKREIPGAVVFIARHGKTAYFETFGYRDREAGVPMSRDAIFHIASMTKPVTIVATMMLIEQGHMKLSDPVSRYLPEFKDVKVGVEKKDASGGLELALESPRREMTILDLMRHTSGITDPFSGQSLVKERYKQEKLGAPGLNNAMFVSRLSRAPLQNHPGEVWDYGVSTDVLGRVVEIVSGMELEQYFAERIFKPLGMPDTDFWVSDPAKRSRVAHVQADTTTGKRPPMPNPSAKGRQSGGGALFSTASDYARFAQMLLNGGELDGVRVISRSTVEQMTRDHLPPGIKINLLPSPVVDVRPEAGSGFGLNLMVRTADGRSAIPGSIGDYGWLGVYGTYFWVDPKKELVVVMMIQEPASSSPALRTKYWTQIRELVYRAVAN